MKRTLFSVVLASIISIAAVYDAEQPRPKLPQKIDEARVESALNAGLKEVKDAIALRAQIEARGHNFNTAAIPEFEAHLPAIENFYRTAFEKSPKKLGELKRLLVGIRSAFKNKKVTLGVWNQLHLHLNDLVSADEKTLPKKQWNLNSSTHFDSFLCFVYRSHGEIGVQTKNFAAANRIWVLPMTSAPGLKMYNQIQSAGEFTNGLMPDYFNESGAKQLLRLYERIEEIEKLKERALAHLTLYNLLRHAGYFSSQEFLDEEGENQRLISAGEYLQDRIVSSGINDTRSDIFRTLFYTTNDVLIEKIDEKRYSVTESSGDVSYKSIATINTDKEGKEILHYVDREGNDLSSPLERRTINNVIDRYALTLFEALGFDTASTAFPKEVVEMGDKFLATL